MATASRPSPLLCFQFDPTGLLKSRTLSCRVVELDDLKHDLSFCPLKQKLLQGNLNIFIYDQLQKKVNQTHM